MYLLYFIYLFVYMVNNYNNITWSRIGPTLYKPMNCSPPGSSVHGILQVRILEWVAMPSSRGSSWSRDRTHVSYISCKFFSTSVTWEAQNRVWHLINTRTCLLMGPLPSHICVTEGQWGCRSQCRAGMRLCLTQPVPCPLIPGSQGLWIQMAA